MPAGPASRPWRRYLRFSMRGLIAFALVICGGLAWMVPEARIQREAVAAIKNARGDVWYNWQWTIGKTAVLEADPWVPGWLIKLIGIDYFGHVTLAQLFTPPTDATLGHLGRRARLQVLNDSSFSLPDAGLAHLRGMTELHTLVLTGANVSDAGLAHVSGLAQLSDLCLIDTRVTDAGIVHLKGLTGLTMLILHRTQVTDAGIKELQQALPGVKIYCNRPRPR
jgi:hypothetical protein